MEQEKKVKHSFKRTNFYVASVPQFSEVFSKYPWVYYGDNNLLPQYLMTQYDNCAIHKSICLSKQNQICGEKITSADNPMATVNLVNGKETMLDIFRKCALDLLLFGGYAINVIWSRDRKTIAELYHVDFSRLRCGKITKEDEDIEKYYFSADWSNLKKYPPKEYQTFNQNKGDASQIFYYKQYSPNLTYYPTPQYSGALNAIEISVEIQNFHKNNLRKGMSPTLWISMLGGIPSEEEQKIIARSLEESYAGTDNAGSAIISFNESKEEAPQITQIATSGNDQYYSTVYEDIIRSILSGHRISSGELYGIPSQNGLGSKDDIVNHSEYQRKMDIIPLQNQLLPTFNMLMSMKYDKPTTFDIKPLALFETGDIYQAPDTYTQKVLDNLNSLDPLVAGKVLESMTPNEIRSLAYLNPVVEGGTLPTDNVNVTKDVVDTTQTGMSVNENIKGLKGREYQAMMRIIRSYNRDQLTRGQAEQMLMSGYGLTKEECDVWLNEEEEIETI